MSTIPDAWEDEWSAAADNSQESVQDQDSAQKKVSTKITKAQKRAQQAEFNRQFWAEAEGPKQPNYFLESRNVVPLRQDFKPAPILLSRKGPILQQKPKPSSPQPPIESLNNLSIASRQSQKNQDSSDDDEEETEESRKKAYEERQIQAAREREEKQRKYEERRLELFGPPAQNANANSGNDTTAIGIKPFNHNKSGNSSPASNTPPHSRSSTPSNRGRRGRGGRGAGGGGAGAGVSATLHQPTQVQPKTHYTQPHLQQHQQQLKELYDPQYAIKPESVLQRQHANNPTNQRDIQPIRAPRGPDGTGRGGFGFANRGGSTAVSATDISQPVQSA